MRSDTFTWGDLEAAVSRAGALAPSFEGMPVYVSEHAAKRIPITLSRWQRVRCWLEDATDRAGLNWPWPRVQRHRFEPAVFRAGNSWIMHPAYWGAIRECADHPGGFAYDPFILRGLL